MNICGINISCHAYQDLLVLLDSPQLVVTVNAEAIVRSQKDLRLKNIINIHTATIDGQIPLWLYRLKYKNHKTEKISGSDLIYSLPEFAEKKNFKVFLLGGNIESNLGAVDKLKLRFPNLQINGFSPPYYPYPFPCDIDNSIRNHLEQFKPDILFVGFGMGKQEFWEEDNYEYFKRLGVKIVVGCGGSFDFVSGKIKRAPLIIQQIGLEGVWRLINEFKWFRIKRLFMSSKIFYYYIKDIMYAK